MKVRRRSAAAAGDDGHGDSDAGSVGDRRRRAVIGEMGAVVPAAGCSMAISCRCSASRRSIRAMRRAAASPAGCSSKCIVNADGSVRSAKVIDAKPRGIFEASAVQAVMRWKFKPKIKNGKPVEQTRLAEDRIQSERRRRAT